MDNFVSLHNHTYYSLLHSIISPKDLFEKAKELGQPAIAVTDTASIGAAWDALQASKKTGVKLIIGCEFYHVDDVSSETLKITHIVLLAKNYVGYKNLLLLHKLAGDNNIIRFGKVTPRIDWNHLEKHNEGLIALTACGGGIVASYLNDRKVEEAFERTKRLHKIFGDNLALEIQAHAQVRQRSNYNDYEDQRFVNRKLVQFGDELGIKIVVTTDAHYLNKEDWEIQDVALAISSGTPVRMQARPKYPAHEFYVKSKDEMIEFLSRYFGERAEEFCNNTLHFADMCEEPVWIDPKWSNPSGNELPTFPVKDQSDYQEFLAWLKTKDDLKEKQEDSNYLRYLTELELKRIGKENDQEYLNRIEKELDVFEFRDLASYMLIVADYVNWARKNKLPVGPGRGSAPASLVGYLLKIHDANPFKYNLIFERFYNKFKAGKSDIDCDFGQRAKPLVEQYLIKKYGKDNVAHISNYNTITPKVYARDIARAFEFGGDRKTAVEIGNTIADSIPKEFNKVQSALEKAPLFSEFAESPHYSQLKTFKSLGGLPRAVATHAAAVVLTKRPVHEIVPVRRDKEGQLAIEYEKERAESNCLDKMDILGVSTLDIIEDTFKLIESCGKQAPPLPWDYDLNDEKAYDLIGSGNTYGVFQFGASAGTANLCVKMQPKNIEDLAMITSMCRPGFPKEVHDEFISDKHKENVANLIHPILKNCLSPTFGYALFDEVLLQLAYDVAGWDLTEADRLRKFVKEKGKYPDKDKILKKDFINGAIKNRGLSNDDAHLIWDKVVNNFGAYIFNKSHAVTYSFLSYQTAYLKAHYPAEFLTANLIFEDSSGTQKADKNKKTLKREIRSLGIKISPPDINNSEEAYRILGSNNILTGFKSLKFMGKDAIPEILAKRPFVSFEDLMQRLDAKKVNIRSVQALAACGCLDGFGLTRKQMFLYASDYRKKLQAWNKRKKKDIFTYPWPEVGEWSLSEMYAMESYYLGEGFCCDYKEAYPNFFDNWAINFSKLPTLLPQDACDDKVTLGKEFGIIEAVVTDYFEFKVKNEKSKIFGEIMAKLDLEDIYGNIMSMTLFPSGVERFDSRLRALGGNKIKLEPGIAIHCAAAANWYNDELSLIFDDLKKVHGIPEMPNDREHKKVMMKAAKEKKPTKELNPDEFLEEIEDELIFEGFSSDDD